MASVQKVYIACSPVLLWLQREANAANTGALAAQKWLTENELEK